MKLRDVFKGKYIMWVIVLLAVVGGIWWWRSSAAATGTTRYGLATVEKTTIVVSVNGSGQVSGNSLLDIKPKVSARVTKVLVKVGDKVKTGQQLVELDRTDAIKAIRDAAQAVNDSRISLASSRLSYDKAKQPADIVSQTAAQDALLKAQRDLDTLKAGPTDYDLKQAQADVDTSEKNIRMTTDGTMPQVVRDSYDQYVITLQAAEQTLAKSLQDTDGILGNDRPVVKPGLTRMFSILNDSIKYQAQQSYQSAKTAVNNAKAAVDALQQTNESLDDISKASGIVSTALDQESILLGDMADGLQASLSSSDLAQSDLDNLKSLIDGDRTSVNSKITSLLNQVQAVQQAKDNYDSAVIANQKAINSLEKLKQGATAADLTTAEEKVKEAQTQVDKLKSGADPLDLQIAQNSVDRSVSALTAAQNKLNDANTALSDYTVVAPFDGIVATVPTQQYADASAGSALLSLVTTQQVATISLNEVDAAKIQVGQKATMTFDAVDSLTITGEVAEVSPVGTVTQGVVNYTIKIAFDSQDDRIKAGMSVTTSIVTQVKADVLAVSNSAVKTQGSQQYVEQLDPSDKSATTSADGLVATKTAPIRTTVQTGVSNDTLTEITGGLNEGDKIIVQTIKAAATAAAATTQNSSSLLRAASTGGARAGGGPGF